AELVQFGWPREYVTRLTNLRVLRGLVFDPPVQTVELVAQATGSGPGLTAVQVELRSGAPSRVHFQLTAEFGPRSTPPVAPVADLVDPRPFPLSVEEAYERWLFQGQRMAHLEALEAVSDNGLEAWLRPSDPSVVIGRSVTGD